VTLLGLFGGLLGLVSGFDGFSNTYGGSPHQGSPADQLTIKVPDL